MWESYIQQFTYYLKLERSLSDNSIQAYAHDIKLFHQFLHINELEISPSNITDTHIRDFLMYVNGLGLSAYTQARNLSGLKSFFRYLKYEGKIEKDPSELIEAPKLGRKIPECLTVEEIDRILEAIDHSKDEGVRNRAILETLYSSGLRVSELVNLEINNVVREIGFLRILGKGNKERLVPIGKTALKHIDIYLEHIRNKLNIKKGNEGFLFLNRRGTQLTRVMIFTIIKRLCKEAGIEKNVSPHTFRHSFATHLIEGGADLRAVQDMLGHESITTTEIYTHLDKEYLKYVVNEYHPMSKL